MGKGDRRAVQWADCANSLPRLPSAAFPPAVPRGWAAVCLCVKASRWPRAETERAGCDWSARAREHPPGAQINHGHKLH